MAWTRGPLDPTRAWPLQPSGPLALDTSEDTTTMFWPWPSFAPPVAPSVPGGYASPQNPPSDPWLDPNFYPPEFPGASRAPIPWLGSDVDGAGPWQADLPPWAFWPGPAPGAWPRREPDLDSGFFEPAPLPWPPPEPSPRRRPLDDDAKPFRPLPYDFRRDRPIPTPEPYYFDQDHGAILPEAQESGAEAPEGARSLLDPRHWDAAEADGARNAGSDAVNRDETGTVEDFARRLGLEPADVAQIDAAPASLLADVLAYRQLDDDARRDVEDRLNAIIEQNRGPSGDPHKFGAALDLRAQLESAAADVSPGDPAAFSNADIDSNAEAKGNLRAATARNPSEATQKAIAAPAGIFDQLKSVIDAAGKMAGVASQNAQRAVGYTRGNEIANLVSREAMAEAARRAGADPETFLEALDGIDNLRERNITRKDPISEALKEAGGDKDTYIANIHNGPVDAWRHAEWSRRVAEELGPILARTFGFGHELVNLGQSAWYQPSGLYDTLRESALMDEPNNVFGVNQRGQGPIPFDHPSLTYFLGGRSHNPTVGPVGTIPYYVK